MSTNQTKEKGSIVSKQHTRKIPHRKTRFTKITLKFSKNSALKEKFLSFSAQKEYLERENCKEFIRKG